jgi:hypothetical protein
MDPSASKFRLGFRPLASRGQIVVDPHRFALAGCVCLEISARPEFQDGQKKKHEEGDRRTFKPNGLCVQTGRPFP